MSSTAEWLEQNLQRRGPGQELPYSADVKWTVRQHLLDLVGAFPALTLKVENYTHTNGSVVPLLVAEGILPMFHQGVRYNVPVAIWLPERYPRTAPIVYVRPTPDMIVKPRHSFVTPSGLVNSEYVRHWRFPSSNLEVLGHDTSIHFGQEPPLYQKPDGYQAAAHSPPPPPPRQQPQQPPPQQSPPPPQQQQPPQQQSFQNPITQGSDPYAGSYGAGAGAADGGGLWGGAVAAASQRPSPPPPPPPPEPARPSDPDLKEVFRGAAMREVARRVSASLAAVNAAAARQTDALFAEQAQLGQRKAALDAGLQALQAERGALETCVLELAGKRAALERWLAENERKTPQGEVDADAAIAPADALSRQALEAQAEDLALEDALYALDRALQEGAIAPEVYMKQVRSIGQKQFFCRALGSKVAERQHGLGRGALAARPSQQHVRIQQGDHWAPAGILANPLASRQ